MQQHYHTHLDVHKEHILEKGSTRPLTTGEGALHRRVILITHNAIPEVGFGTRVHSVDGGQILGVEEDVVLGKLKGVAPLVKSNQTLGIATTVLAKNGSATGEIATKAQVQELRARSVTKT